HRSQIFHPLSRLRCIYFGHRLPRTTSSLSLHDALPIWGYTPDPVAPGVVFLDDVGRGPVEPGADLGQLPVLPQVDRLAADHAVEDRKSTRLKSSPVSISYAVLR